MLAFLERTGPDPRRWSALEFNQRMRLVEKTLPKGQRLSNIFLPAILSSPLHGLRDARDVLSGMFFAGEQLYAELVNFDARRLSRHFEIPVFVFQGANDAFTRPEVAEAYFAELEAPIKHFERLPNVGHLGAFVLPEAFLDRLRQHVVPIVALRSVEEYAVRRPLLDAAVSARPRSPPAA
jgi:pimeloyl-ACP methyl ester carboxylesterase